MADAGQAPLSLSLTFRARETVPHVLASLGVERQDLDDLTQDVLLAVFETESTRFNRLAATSTWIYAICRNLVSKHRRSRKVRYAFQGGTSADPPPFEVTVPIEANELAERVRRVLADLSSRHRVALELLELDERSYEEVAELLNLSVPATRVLRHRARHEFRRKAIILLDWFRPAVSLRGVKTAPYVKRFHASRY